MGLTERIHLCTFVSLVASLTTAASAQNQSFDFPEFSLRNLTLLGDSYLRNGSIGLTKQTGVPSSSSGSAIFNSAVRFRDLRSNASASFSTRFSFSVANVNPASGGDGLTFFVSACNETLGGTGGFLGLFNSSAVDAGPVIAVEFDTRLDEAFNDSGPNHVGLDIDGPSSVVAVDLGEVGIDLRSGILITAWVDYHNDDKLLMVWMSYSNVKPEKPVLVSNCDLSTHFEEFMYVGFSASTEGSTETHTVDSWSFQTFGFPAPAEASSPVTVIPQNLTDGEWSVIPAAVPLTEESRTSRRKKLTLGLGIAGPVAFCALFALVSRFLIKRRLSDGGERFQSEILRGPRKFSFKELSIATRGFHGSRIVGSGAFGTVYRAVHPGTGVTYAVKRSKQAHEGKSEFLAEVTIIGGLRHKNLVQLQGWCAEKGELFLVYEFMPNGSLDRLLYHRGGKGPSESSSSAALQIKWPQRYNVAVGIASVLTYLHQECEQQVIHRDIKTSNIMLDAGFNPRLGDFGLARLTEHDKSPVSTLTAGTMGYLAPEYLQYGKATEKTDVFSYGVVVLEVCCGRRPIDSKQHSDRHHHHHNQSAAHHQSANLVDWVWGLHAEDKLIEAVDPRLDGEFDGDEMVRLLLVGLSCANPNFEERPSMRRVLQILNREADPPPVPRKKPTLQFSTSVALSLNDIVGEGAEDSVVSSPLRDDDIV